MSRLYFNLFGFNSSRLAAGKFISMFFGLFAFGNLFVYAEDHLLGNSHRGRIKSDLDTDQKKLNSAREEFKELYNSLPDSAKGAINSHCGDGGSQWIENLKELNNNAFYQSLEECNSSLSGTSEQVSLESLTFQRFGHSTDLDTLKKVFPKHEEAIINIRDESLKHRSAMHNPDKIRRTRGSRGRPDTANSLLNRSSDIGLVQTARKKENQPFYMERKELLQDYGCGDKFSVVDCLAQRAGKDKECLEKVGFKKCRPFLECDKRKRLPDLRKLSAELNRENKDGMAYICWKAATQGAQCCMNPDQCPTDGAFRNIAGQLKQAGPGLIRQFAGLKAITGQNQAACRANLMANAAGPLAGLRTKTCNDSSKACEETCDEKVQDFKARLKQALAGDRAKEVNIDELVSTAEELHDGEDIPDEEGEIKTCSLMLVKLNRDFKKRKEDTKLRGLTEQLSHASIVDCSEEVEKYAFHRRRGGSSGPGGGISPFASRMCRNAAGGFIPPKGPFAGVTPNPNLGSAHLLGGKTVPGKGASGPYFGGPGGLPAEEFIEPERGVSGAGHLSGGWTESRGDSSAGSPGGGPGGGLSQSPSEDGPGSEEELDTLSPSVPEGFDLGGGGSESGVSGEDMSPEDLRRLELAKKMEEMETKKLMKETPREHFGPPDENIFDRVSRSVRAWCKKEGCLD